MRKLKFKGNGTSLWGKSDGEYTVTQLDIPYINKDDPDSLYGEVQLFGPDTEDDLFLDLIQLTTVIRLDTIQER